MSDFVMPSLGADMEAAALVKWRTEPGAHISRGDIIAEVDTDKGVIEIECFESGVVERLVLEPGTKAPVGALMAVIRGDDESAPAAAPSQAVDLTLSDTVTAGVIPVLKDMFRPS